MESERKNAYVHTFLSKQHLSRRESVDLRVTLASRPSFVSPFSPFSRVMVHGLIPITMNLSDVKTQSPPESGLPSSALRPGDHKSRGICDRISYTSWHIPACNVDAVKEAVKSERERPRRREVVALETRGWREREREEEKGRGKKEKEREGRGPPGFLYVRWRGDGKTGEIARSGGESCKLENFPRPYYLRRDHRPAPRGLSGIPRSLNTPPSSRTTLVCFGGCFERAKRGRMNARKNRDLKRTAGFGKSGLESGEEGEMCISYIFEF